MMVLFSHFRASLFGSFVCN